MLDHISVPQNIPEHRCILLNDRGIGDHIDHPLQSLLHSVLQGKRQRGYCFSAPCRYCQGVNAPGQSCLFLAFRKNGTSVPVQFRVPRKPGCNVGVQPFQQYGKRIIASTLRLPLCHETLRIQKVSIHQTGIEHSCPHKQDIRIGDGGLPAGPGQCPFPMTGWDSSGLGFSDPACTGGCAGVVQSGIAKVWKSPMMPHHTAGRSFLPDFCAFQRPGGGMIHRRAAMQPFLKTL